MVETKRYRLGIDVGINSLGICAVELDDGDHPERLLNCQVVVHDGGLDPTAQKISGTRLAVSGVARRARHLVKQRRRRLEELDKFIVSQGWPLTDLSDSDDPFLPWRVRAELADGRVPTEELGEKLSIALRHIARHRGWRNSFTRVESLLSVDEPSKFFEDFRSHAEDVLNYDLSNDDLTTAQIVMLVGLVDVKGGRRLRANGEKEGLLRGKLHQSDNAREIRKIFETQGLDQDLAVQAINKVFMAKRPGAKAAEKAGRDPLPGQDAPRALRASLVFEEYRVAAALGNVRVVGPGEKRRLTPEEMKKAFKFLTSRVDNDVMWADVAEYLGLPSASLRGAAADLDGERLSAKPPVMVTESRVLAAKIKPLSRWWETADTDDRDNLVKVLTHGEELDESLGGLLAELDENDLAKLDQINLSPGRAAYGEDSLRRLTARMLNDGCDLYAARKTEFGVENDWQPKAPPIGEPIGNPSTDRVLKETARVINALRSVYGDPLSVNIEHVREGFASTQMAKQRDAENQKRYKRNREILEQIMKEEQLSSPPRREDVQRYLAYQRQGGVCVYCGEPITFRTAEMDHIVPRAGVGSTNTRNNLVAVCRRCNQSKGKMNFARWADECGIPGVSLAEAVARVEMWEGDSSDGSASTKRFKRDVISRLKRTDEDPEIDGRSMESVAWMARELRRRVDQEIKGATVNVYRGELTAEARKASGIEKMIPYIGGSGKTRFDRRHHAVDAAVIAMMRPAVAKVLAERTELRREQRYSTGEDSSVWKQYQGSSPILYQDWKQDMNVLADLLKNAFAEDRIPIRQNLRLRMANSAAHEANPSSLENTGRKGAKAPRYRLGDALPVDVIDRAGTPALWCALTRLPDFNENEGLPEDPSRIIKVNGRVVTADELLPIGPDKAFVLVRGGYASIGDRIHHARVYRIPGKKNPVYGMVRVFAEDLRRHAKEDLFNVRLAPQSISLRMADHKVRQAVLEGSAEYLGWLVANDEIHLNMSRLKNDKVGRFMKILPMTSRWRVVGFGDPRTLSLKPIQLAEEGFEKLPPDSEIVRSKDVHDIVAGHGWRVKVNVLFGNHAPIIIRRDSLGRPRLVSAAHLPVCWNSDHGTMAGS